LKKSTRIQPENRGSSWLKTSAEVGIKAGGKQKLLLFFAKFANNLSVCQETSNKIEESVPFDSDDRNPVTTLTVQLSAIFLHLFLNTMLVYFLKF